MNRRVARAVLAFMAAGLVAVVLSAALGAWLVRRSATSEAVRDARVRTVTEGRAIVGPLLDDGILTGDPTALDRLDEAVRRMLDRDLVRVKVWAGDGRILYSDEPRLIGARYDLGADDLHVLTAGGVEAAVSDLAKPENRFERRYGKLLEVYLDLHTTGGTPVLFETYFRYSAVTRYSTELWHSFLPALLGGLLLLYVVQLPLAWRMARRLEQGQAERERLLRRAIDSSDVERRRIAADLHDGVVQGLAGASYSLAAAADRAAQADLPDVAATVARAASDLRLWQRELRTLLVSIAPPTLHEEGLGPALSDLASVLNARGVATELDVADELDLGVGAEALVYRAAQEAVRNVTVHAAASRVRIAVSQVDGVVRLEVTDDGRGFDDEDRRRKAGEGHVGLSLLDGLVAEAGGTLHIDSAVGRGTTLRLEVPR
jgi:signal transduction histidine kinase